MIQTLLKISTPSIRLNLGCPKYCNEYVCIDTNPINDKVIKADVLSYITTYEENSIDEIYSKNLLEHLTEINTFMSNCFNALKPNGRIVIITDNAEFLPYYIPFIHRFGIGAHSSNKYFDNYKYQNCTPHYMLFTKMHLINIMQKYGFQVLECKRDIKTLGARLICKAIKPISLERQS